MATLVVLVVIGTCLLAETAWSRRNEARLRAQGAVEAAGDAYRWMQVAYPGGFAAMALESWWWGGPSRGWLLAGAAVFVVAKALKYAAIGALGDRWSFRVLVLRDAPLVTRGPYRCLRHPNYVAVLGEFIAALLLFGAPVTGTLATALFAVLLARRVRVENAALGRARRPAAGRP